MIYDREMEILEDCFSEKTNDVLILSDNNNSKVYNKSVKTYEGFLDSNDWYDNSQNTNMPPDIINRKLRVYFEVMKFDDHSKNGKENPYRAKASKMQEEILEKMPEMKDKTIIVNPVTTLPTDEDHSYKKYISGFKRTVEKHLNKLSKYDENCPNFKKGFLVLDESSGIYYELVDRLRSEELEYRTGALCIPHWFFLDKAFVDVFINSDLDYLIWYAPYKIDTNHLELKMPKVIFFDIKSFKCHFTLKTYDEPRMISCEE